MGEVKNAFIKSKMNKDLDSRLVPSGEYRNAINAQVGRSDSSDVGTVENALGNTLIATFGGSIENLSCIGFTVDEPNNDIYVFLTDNVTDEYTATGAGSNHFIYRYNTLNSSPPLLLVSGAFLNFSKLNPIYGVNLLEKLLFWTDNRNQPRKINVGDAQTTGYYTTEDQISVAKYNPYQVIELFKPSEIAGLDTNGQVQYETTMKSVDTKFLPNGGSCISSAVTNSDTPLISQISIPFYPKKPFLGMTVNQVNSVDAIVPLTLNGVDQSITVVDYTPSNNELELSSNVDIAVDTELIFNSNPYYINNYPGDSDLNKDKFIRFSYRFKFKDGEYSIIAPFTQVCFIPNQDGYFLTDNYTSENGQFTYTGDMDQAYGSTVVDFMENKVDEIRLQIPLPTSISYLSSELHIDEIDILYKESDGLSIKVVETLKVSNLPSSTLKSYEYVYQSQKPYKTLPSKEITRVYDKVPVKALAQEIISNRVVYSNYQDKHTPPSSLNYNVSANSKSNFSVGSSIASLDSTSSIVNSDSFDINNITGDISVGDVLNGSYGTESYDVLVTSITTNAGDAVIVVNQNVNIPFQSVLTFQAGSPDSNTTSVVEYPNSSLKNNRNYQVGVVLSDKFGRQSTVILSNSKTPITVGTETYVGSTIYSPYESGLIDPVNWLGNSLKMLFNEGIATSGPNIDTKEPGLYNGESTSVDYNPLGWYSYKIVVKQTEQEYYNVYSAGVTKGLPYNYNDDGATISQKNTSFLSLVNDNINKVPRDLSEVGPQDKSFRSSVVLYGRVENGMREIEGVKTNFNQQFYPGKTSFITSSIENLFDIFKVDSILDANTPAEPISITDSTNPFSSFYKSSSNPLIAQLTTSQDVNKQFGAENVHVGAVTDPYKSITSLTVLETKPVDSRLDIFWETSTSGLISDLNTLVLNSGGSSGFRWNTSPFTEALQPGGEMLLEDFTPLDAFGSNIPPADIQSLTMAVSISGSPQSGTTNVPQDYFTLVDKAPLSPGFYNIQVTSEFEDDVYYGSVENIRMFQFEFTLQLAPVDGVLPPSSTFNKQGDLRNVEPTIDRGQHDFTPLNFDSFVSTDFPSYYYSGPFSEHSATNGCFPGTTAPPFTGSPNRYGQLRWELQPVSPIVNPVLFDLNGGADQGGNPIIKIVRPGQSAILDGGVYSMDLQATDADDTGLDTSIRININTIAPVVANNCEDIYTKWTSGGGDPDQDIYAEAVIFQVAGFSSSASAGNGWYIYNKYFSDLTGGDSSVDLRLNRSFAYTSSNSASWNNGKWFFASTKQDVLDIYWVSIPNTSLINGTYAIDSEIAISTLGDYTIVVK